MLGKVAWVGPGLIRDFKCDRGFQAFGATSAPAGRVLILWSRQRPLRWVGGSGGSAALLELLAAFVGHVFEKRAQQGDFEQARVFSLHQDKTLWLSDLRTFLPALKNIQAGGGAALNTSNPPTPSKTTR